MQEVTKCSRREVKRYRAVVCGGVVRHYILYCHSRLHCSTERSWVGSGAHIGSRHARPAQRNIELWRSVIPYGSSLPIIGHSAHEGCIGSFGSGLDDFAHWIYNIPRHMLLLLAQTQRSEARWVFSEVCLFVCMFVCPHDNFLTSKRRTINLGG